MKSEALRRGKAGGGRIFKKRKSTSKKDIVSNKNAKNTDIIDNSVSSSAKKLRKSQEYFSNSAAVQPTMSSISYDKNTASVNIDTHQTDTGRLNQSQYIIIDIETLKSMFNLVGLCPECKGEHLDLIVNNGKKKGLSTMDNGGAGCLTEKMINNLQNYFGIAIRQCSGKSAYEMKKAVEAVLFHCSEATSLDSRHMMCPRTSESWCKYQADRINNTNTYKHKPGLPIIVKDATKRIFMDLYDIDLLKKCLHGETQNNNEGFKCHYMEKLPERCLCRLDST